MHQISPDEAIGIRYLFFSTKNTGPYRAVVPPIY